MGTLIEKCNGTALQSTRRLKRTPEIAADVGVEPHSRSGLPQFGSIKRANDGIGQVSWTVQFEEDVKAGVFA